MRTMDLDKIRQIINHAKDRGAGVLLETEGLEILACMGIATPAHLFVSGSNQFRDARKPRAPDCSPGMTPAPRELTLDSFGKRVVIKVVSPQVIHKTEAGGVRIVPTEREAIALAIREMEYKLGEREISGFTISQHVDYDARPGGELLIGLRWTDDFGPVVTLGPGGVYAEFLSGNLKPGSDVAILSAQISDQSLIRAAIHRCAVGQLLSSSMRECAPRLRTEKLVDVIERFMALGRELPRGLIRDFEINPLVVAEGELVALDVLIRLGDEQEAPRPGRPVSKLKNLLEPSSVAVIGVSEKLNPGHIIVNNLIREGFDRRRIYIVKPGADSIEGCECFADISSLPEKVDLIVLAIAAARVPEAIERVIDLRVAESLIVIPGGLEERAANDESLAGIRSKLAEARRTKWRGPVINGGNCLGVRSRPGRIDTMFIPDSKLPRSGKESPLAIISQSGAFAISRTSKLENIDPKYSITLGNQMDLTVGDCLTYLKDDAGIAVFGVYVEGFAKLDGIAFLEAAHEITSSGRSVILYRAGRTPAGATASSSHTAAIAGDYAVTRELCTTAGVVVADTLADFEDLLRLFALLDGKRVDGLRLGAISNAGFECVAIADRLGAFTLPDFNVSTTERLKKLLKDSRVDSIVEAHNPLDLTPMMDDAGFEEAVRAVIEDNGVDVGVVGCVPLTAALNTMNASEAHPENALLPSSIASRLVRLNGETRKAYVAVVDAGALYDPMARLLEEGGIPTFRTADRALRAFGVYCGERLKSRSAVSTAAGARVV